MTGQHRVNPPSPRGRIRKVLIWCCSEGKHVLIELPAGLAAIMAFEMFLRPHLIGPSHESALHMINNFL